MINPDRAGVKTDDILEMIPSRLINRSISSLSSSEAWNVFRLKKKKPSPKPPSKPIRIEYLDIVSPKKAVIAKRDINDKDDNK